VTGGGTGLTIAADRHQQRHHDPTLGDDDEDDTTTYGPVVVAYRQQFAIDDDLVNAEQLQATLVDGVLTIMLPKKEAAQPIPVPVIEGEAVIDGTDGTAGDLRITFDIPGVKADELQVVVHHGMLTITMVRAQKRGGHNHDSFAHRVQRRTMMLDRHRTDLTASKAYLSHGVLTFTAPHKTSVAAKTVPLNATTTLMAAAVEQKPTKVLVETVSEEDAGAAVAMNMM
jgi:HSP20 family molecular chaperone IbpA